MSESEKSAETSSTPESEPAQSGDTPASDVSSSGTAAEAAGPSQGRQGPSRMKVRLIAVGAALVGMMTGAVVEMFVQGAMESTGWFGPTLESLVDEQNANFDAIQDKLAALEAATSPEERKRLQSELDELFAEQRQLAGQTHEELRRSHEELQALRDQLLAEQGVSGGVDFWLEPGQSVSVGSRQNVFALLRVYPDRVIASMSGEQTALKPGDAMQAKVEEGVYRVFLRRLPDRGEGQRVGFDLVKPGE